MRRRVPRHNVRSQLFDVAPKHVDPDAVLSRAVLDLQRHAVKEEVVAAISLPTHLYIPQREASVSVRKQQQDKSRAHPSQAETFITREPLVTPSAPPLETLPSREALLELMAHFEREEQARARRMRSYTWQELGFSSSPPAVAVEGMRIPWEAMRDVLGSLATRGLRLSLAGIILVLLVYGSVRAFFWTEGKLSSLRGELLQQGAQSAALLEEGRSLLLAGRFEEAGRTFRALKDRMALPSPVVALASLVPFPDKWKVMLSGSLALRSAAHLGESASLLASSLSEDSSSEERSERFEAFEGALRAAVPLLADLEARDLPPELASGSLELGDARNLLEHILLWLAPAKALAGFNGERAYLLLFQNNSELRATGGFIGTYGLIKVKDGRVAEFWVDDVYNRDGQLPLAVVPPRSLQGITARWGLRDSNWFFDFPTSASKAAWFFEEAGGESVDGVIALTPSLISKLLILTGPIVVSGEVSVAEKDVSVDAANLIEILQREVYEARSQGEAQPKTFVKEFGSQLFERVSSLAGGRPVEIWEAIHSSLLDKELLIWLKSDALHAHFAARGWDGSVASTLDSDYLAVVISNIKGFKADYVTQNEFSYAVTLSDGGSLVGELVVRRAHLGRDAPYAWWRRANLSWVRVLVPRGSRLLEVKGAASVLPPLLETYSEDFFHDPDLEKVDAMLQSLPGSYEVLEEAGKTVFAAWLQIPPGELRSLTFRYLLPSTLSLAPRYRLTWQKQPGVQALYEVRMPDGREVTGALSRDVIIE